MGLITKKSEAENLVLMPFKVIEVQNYGRIG
jgi:hypothetical protein